MGETGAEAGAGAGAGAGGYDVIILGAGIAGASLGISLGRQGRKVLVLERDLAPPDTFRGELIQPGGIDRLRELGLEGPFHPPFLPLFSLSLPSALLAFWSLVWVFLVFVLTKAGN